MKMLNEFKEFAMRGNVMDMAVGVIVGAAFGKIVTSLVNDILMPPIGLLIGKVNFSGLFVNLSRTRHFDVLEQAKAAGVPTLNYGLFFSAVFDFIIVAFVIFMMSRVINRLKRQAVPATPAPPAAPTTRECPFCLSSISIRATRCAHCTSEVTVQKESRGEMPPEPLQSRVDSRDY